MAVETPPHTVDADSWLKAGSRAQVAGLQSAPAHNGKQGILLSASESADAADAVSKGRIAILLDSGKLLALKPANLQSVAYIVCQIDGKGMGVIAARDIKCGERLIAEPPLVIVSRGSTKSAIADVEAFSSAKRAVFDSLHNAQKARRAGQPFADILGIISSNAYNMDESRLGVFATISRFNHSCIPSVELAWNDKLQAETVHACRDICCGEELCSSYLSVEDDPGLCSSRDARCAELQKGYVFACSCPVCTLAGKKLAESDNRRLTISNLDAQIFEAMQQGQHADAEGFVVTRLQLLSEEGLEEAGVKRRCSYDGYQACKAAGWHDKARTWLSSSAEEAFSAAGADSAAYEKVKRMLQRPIEAPHDPCHA